MSERVLIYGANGYTGRLLAAEAARRGLDVVLAGRSDEDLKEVASPLGMESRVVILSDPHRLEAALDDVRCVLHAAGPFSQTAAPMVEACLATETHYLDVTGEIDVFETIARRDKEAQEVGIMMLPGVGFDVVPSDCLAAHVASRVDEPRSLRIAIAGIGGGTSRGTAKTALESLGEGLRIRRDGILVTRPAGSLGRNFEFGAGPARGIAVSWGDVATAFHSTGIPDIEVYFIVGGRMPGLLKASRTFAPLFRLGFVQSFLRSRIERMPPGPDERARSNSEAVILVEVEGPGEQFARSRLETPSGYTLTYQAAIEIAARVADGFARPGFQTPSSAFGADFVLELPNCRRVDLD